MINQHKRILSFLTVFLFFLFGGVFASNPNPTSIGINGNFHSLDFIGVYKSNSTLLVSYSISKTNIVTGNVSFNVESYYNNTKYNSCNTSISFNQSSFSNGIVCPVPIKGSGSYMFKAQLLKDGTILENSSGVYILSSNANLTQHFKNEGNKTIVYIDINSNINHSFIVTSLIPKSVISNLNYQNVKSLIKSNRNFTILNSDPLIAWNLQKAPAKINYTIYKNINESTQQKFLVDFKNSNQVNVLGDFFLFLVIILVIIIMYMIFRPQKDKKNE